jgi:hypothetical protein
VCEDLKEELDHGKQLAIWLVHHLRDMGAGSATIPVYIQDEEYTVTVTHKPVTPLESDVS